MEAQKGLCVDMCFTTARLLVKTVKTVQKRKVTCLLSYYRISLHVRSKLSRQPPRGLKVIQSFATRPPMTGQSPLHMGILKDTQHWLHVDDSLDMYMPVPFTHQGWQLHFDGLLRLPRRR